MSASQKTPNYNLPLFAPEDITDWLTDFNGAMSMIDGDLHGLSSSITKTQITSGELDTRVGALEGEYNTLNSQVTNNSTSLSQIIQRTTTNEEAIQNLETEYSNLSGEVAQNEANITSQQNTLSSLDTTVQSQQTTIVQNTSEIQGLNSTITTTNNTVRDLNMRIENKFVVCGIAFGVLQLSHLPQVNGKTIKIFKYDGDIVKFTGLSISGNIGPNDKIILIPDKSTNVLFEDQDSSDSALACGYFSTSLTTGSNRFDGKGVKLSEIGLDDSNPTGEPILTAELFTKLIAGPVISDSNYQSSYTVVNYKEGVFKIQSCMVDFIVIKSI